MFLSVVFLFSPSLFKCLHLQSTNTHITTLTHKTTNIKKNNFEKNINTEKQQYIISQPEPERYLFAVGSRAGYPVCLFLLLFSKLFCFIAVSLCVCLCFRQFKFSLEHNTIHCTKHKQTRNGFVHDLCQMLKVMFKFI